MQITFPNRSAKPTGFVGKLFISLFFAVFLGMGTFFEMVILRSLQRDFAANQWPTVDCHIVQSAAILQSDQDSKPYSVAIRYLYRYGGEEYKADRLSLTPLSFGDYSAAAAVAARFPVGATVLGRVNPANPSESFLQGRHSASVFLLLFPLIFVAVGAGASGSRGANRRPGRRQPFRKPPRPAHPRAGCPGCLRSFCWPGWRALGGC
jgi:hypothetical protein